MSTVSPSTSSANSFAVKAYYFVTEAVFSVFTLNIVYKTHNSIPCMEDTLALDQKHNKNLRERFFNRHYKDDMNALTVGSRFSLRIPSDGQDEECLNFEKSPQQQRGLTREYAVRVDTNQGLMVTRQKFFKFAQEEVGTDFRKSRHVTSRKLIGSMIRSKHLNPEVALLTLAKMPDKINDKINSQKIKLIASLSNERIKQLFECQELQKGGQYKELRKYMLNTLKTEAPDKYKANFCATKTTK